MCDSLAWRYRFDEPSEGCPSSDWGSARWTEAQCDPELLPTSCWGEALSQRSRNMVGRPTRRAHRWLAARLFASGTARPCFDRDGGVASTQKRGARRQIGRLVQPLRLAAVCASAAPAIRADRPAGLVSTVSTFSLTGRAGLSAAPDQFPACRAGKIWLSGHAFIAP